MAQRAGGYCKVWGHSNGQRKGGGPAQFDTACCMRCSANPAGTACAAHWWFSQPLTHHDLVANVHGVWHGRQRGHLQTAAAWHPQF